MSRSHISRLLSAAAIVFIVGLPLVGFWLLDPYLPDTFRTGATIYAVLAALAYYCVDRAITEWESIGKWRRAYAVVTAGGTSLLLLGFLVLVACDEMLAPQVVMAARHIHGRGGRVHVDELRSHDVSVSLTGPQVNDADLACLEAIPRLRSLELFGARITDTGLKNLVRSKELRSLDLSYTEVTDAALELLAGFVELEELRLDSTSVTDAGLDRLQGLAKLRQLSLQGTKVTDGCVQALQKALPACDIRH